MKIKNIFIFGAVLILIAFLMVWIYKQGGILNLQRTALQKIPDRPDFSFSEVVISEIAGNNKYWEIRSAKAIIDKNRAKLYDLNGVIYKNNKRTLFFRSPEALADLNRGNFKIYNVRAKTYLPQQDPWHLNTEIMLWDRKKELLAGQKNVQIWKKNISFSGEYFWGEIGLSKFSLKKNVKGKISQIKDTADGSVSKDVLIAAEELLYDSRSNHIQASENVVLTYPEFQASGKYLFYNNSNEDFIFKEKVEMIYKSRESQADAYLSAQEVSYSSSANAYNAQGKVKFSYEDIKCTSQKAVFYRDKEYLEFTGSVQVFEGKRRFIGEKITVYLNPKKIVTTGRSKFISPK